MEYDYNNQEYLQHYGVVGMKWGVRKAVSKMNKMDKLERKAAKYDIKAAKLSRKSEKRHATRDLGRANKKAVKAAKYDIKAAKMQKKALNSESEKKRLRYEKKAANMSYKSTKNKIDGNRLSKTKGYGKVAMRYSVKSDKVAKKAAKARLKIAKNKVYIDRVNRKVSEINPNDLQGAYSFVEKLNRA